MIFSRGKSRAVFTVSMVSIIVVVVASGQQLSAGEWPQILGPNRNGVAVDERLVESLPKGGPAVIWEHKVGEGYSGAAVAGGRVVVFHRLGNEEIVEGLDPITGRPHWKQQFPATYSGGINPDTGPRCVPVIHDGSVY